VLAVDWLVSRVLFCLRIVLQVGGVNYSAFLV